MHVDGRVDVHDIHLRIRDQIFEAGIAFVDTVLLADLVQFLPCALADRIHVRIRMLLIDWNEFLAETESYDGDIELLLRHFAVPFYLVVSPMISTRRPLGSF